MRTENVVYKDVQASKQQIRNKILLSELPLAILKVDVGSPDEGLGPVLAVLAGRYHVTRQGA